MLLGKVDAVQLTSTTPQDGVQQPIGSLPQFWSVADPLEATANNFILCVPLVVIVSLLFLSDYRTTTLGLALAAVSGGVTSGIGYAIWYEALKGLPATSAATVQLSVPAIAALGGLVFMSEDLTVRLLFASAATLGGVWIVLAHRART